MLPICGVYSGLRLCVFCLYSFFGNTFFGANLHNFLNLTLLAKYKAFQKRLSNSLREVIHLLRTCSLILSPYLILWSVETLWTLNELPFQRKSLIISEIGKPS